MLTFRVVLHDELAALAGGRGAMVRRLPEPSSVKDAVEAVGVPHVEIGGVVLDGRPGGLGAAVADGMVVEVFAAGPHPLREARFLCDLHLGKLARLLRFCGYDTAWDPDLREPGLARLAVAEGRVVVSRHRALLKRGTVRRGLLVRSNHADGQLAEVLRRFALAADLRARLDASPPATGRCTRCNGALLATARDDVTAPIPPRTAAWRDRYWVCRDCGHLFWEGTHVERLRARVRQVVDGISRGSGPSRTAGT